MDPAGNQPGGLQGGEQPGTPEAPENQQASPSGQQTQERPSDQPPVEFDPFDASNPDAASDGQTVGERFGDGPRDDIGPASERFSPASVQRAQQAAEQAIERQGVPPDRRSLIRRVYQRLAERAQQQSAAPPAENASPDGGSK